MDEALGILIRVSFAYLYALALVRLTGKRDLGYLSATDLVVTFIVSDLFDDIIWGDVPVSQGAVGLATVMLLHVFVSYLALKYHAIERIVSGQRAVLVANGQFVTSGMRKERLRREEVLSQLRLQGTDDPAEVKEAAVEASGQTSVLRQEPARPADRRDLPRLRRMLP